MWTIPVALSNNNDEEPRERVLTGSELPKTWDAASDDHYGQYPQLLMLTGPQADEIAGVRRLAGLTFNNDKVCDSAS